MADEIRRDTELSPIKQEFPATPNSPTEVATEKASVATEASPTSNTPALPQDSQAPSSPSWDILPEHGEANWDDGIETSSTHQADEDAQANPHSNKSLDLKASPTRSIDAPEEVVQVQEPQDVMEPSSAASDVASIDSQVGSPEDDALLSAQHQTLFSRRANPVHVDSKESLSSDVDAPQSIITTRAQSAWQAIRSMVAQTYDWVKPIVRSTTAWIYDHTPSVVSTANSALAHSDRTVSQLGTSLSDTMLGNSEDIAVKGPVRISWVDEHGTVKPLKFANGKGRPGKWSGKIRLASRKNGRSDSHVPMSSSQSTSSSGVESLSSGESDAN